MTGAGKKNDEGRENDNGTREPMSSRCREYLYREPDENMLATV